MQASLDAFTAVTKIGNPQDHVNRNMKIKGSFSEWRHALAKGLVDADVWYRRIRVVKYDDRHDFGRAKGGKKQGLLFQDFFQDP